MKNKALVISLIAILTACSNNANKEVFEVSLMVKNATDYVKENMSLVDDSLMGTYHMHSPIGWLNDPNGFSEFNDEYHLFYQYNPYNSSWGSMHWGHQTTKDFIKWEVVDVALAPDEDYDQNGCFSGTALIEDNRLYIAYTSVDKDWNQDQSIAYSEDGITFKKLDNNPVISIDLLPEGYSHANFRDPKIFKRDDKYYLIACNQDPLTNEKVLVLFESDSIESGWKFRSNIYARSDVGGMLECPDLFTIDNMDVLVLSPQSIKSDKYYEFQNVDSSTYIVGNLSTNTYKFYKTNSSNLEEFDKGFSFYAPQVLSTSDGRNILTAWMNTWSETNVTQGYNWSGSMVLPRELSLKDGHLYQKPVRELSNYYCDNIKKDSLTLNNSIYNFDVQDNCCSIEFEIDLSKSNNNVKAGIEVYKSDNYSTRIYYDVEKGCVIFDRTNCGSVLNDIRYAKVEQNNNKIKLQILLDISSCEVFINDGYYTMTGNIFQKEQTNSLSFFVENGEADFININYNHINTNK